MICPHTIAWGVIGSGAECYVKEKDTRAEGYVLFGPMPDTVTGAFIRARHAMAAEAFTRILKKDCPT